MSDLLGKINTRVRKYYPELANSDDKFGVAETQHQKAKAIIKDSAKSTTPDQIKTKGKEAAFHEGASQDIIKVRNRLKEKDENTFGL